MTETPAGIRYSSVTLLGVIRRAYALEPFQLLGVQQLVGPTDLYDITATFPEGAGKDQIPTMLQQVLTERFQFAFHREHRQISVYALLVDKAGLKLRKVDPPAETQGEPKQPRAFRNGEIAHLDGRMTLERLAQVLSGWLRRTEDRPVLNMTGTDGEFEIELNARLPMTGVIDEPASPIELPNGKRIEADAPLLFAALQKLGLRLEPRRTSMEFLVADKINKEPTRN